MSLQLHRPDGKGGVEPRTVTVLAVAPRGVGEVREHDREAVDAERGMDKLSVRAGNAAVFDGIERLDVEVDGGSGVIDRPPPST